MHCIKLKFGFKGIMARVRVNDHFCWTAFFFQGMSASPYDRAILVQPDHIRRLDFKLGSVFRLDHQEVRCRVNVGTQNARIDSGAFERRLVNDLSECYAWMVWDDGRVLMRNNPAEKQSLAFGHLIRAAKLLNPLLG